MTTDDADKAPELMGAAEAAAALGVMQSNLRVIPGLPAPVQKLRSGSVWLAEDIRRFAEARAKAKANRIKTTDTETK